MTPMHYVAGRDCNNILEAFMAFAAKYPDFATLMLLIFILAVVFVVYAFYKVFINPEF